METFEISFYKTANKGIFGYFPLSEEYTYLTTFKVNPFLWSSTNFIRPVVHEVREIIHFRHYKAQKKQKNSILGSFRLSERYIRLRLPTVNHVLRSF